MAEITGVETSYTVRVDESAVSANGAGADLGMLLALVGSLAEEGFGPELFRELLRFRDDRSMVRSAQRALGADGSVIAVGLSSLQSATASRDPVEVRP